MKTSEQKIYKALSESATRLFDSLLSDDLLIDTHGELNELNIARGDAINTMGSQWTNNVIKQSFNLIADCYKSEEK